MPAQLVGAHQGKPAVLDLTLVDVHYKNPLASLLVGDSNTLTAKGVLRGEDGTEITALRCPHLGPGRINGIAARSFRRAGPGARGPAMARALAKDLERRIYGKVTREPAQIELAPKLGEPAPVSAAPRAPLAPAPKAGEGRGRRLNRMNEGRPRAPFLLGSVVPVVAVVFRLEGAHVGALPARRGRRRAAS